MNWLPSVSGSQHWTILVQHLLFVRVLNDQSWTVLSIVCLQSCLFKFEEHSPFPLSLISNEREREEGKQIEIDILVTSWRCRHPLNWSHYDLCPEPASTHYSIGTPIHPSKKFKGKRGKFSCGQKEREDKWCHRLEGRKQLFRQINWDRWRWTRMNEGVEEQKQEQFLGTAPNGLDWILLSVVAPPKNNSIPDRLFPPQLLIIRVT